MRVGHDFGTQAGMGGGVKTLKGLGGLDLRALRPGDRVCCAVSGGADSVALLCALVEANAAKESLGVVLRAVHVHHGLRGEEADGDEQFVRALCERLGVDLHLKRVNTPARQVEAREGAEEAARHLRYGVFWRLLGEGWADAVVTAHTTDDQAETVLMKLLRGAWTEGLGAISPVLAASAGEKAAAGRIVRPMLGVRRSEVERFLGEREQNWREDSSNRDVSLLRNRVRHEVMPLLRTLNPALEEALVRTAAIARDEEAYWQAETARVLPGIVLPGKPVRGGGRAVSTAVGQLAVALELERLKALAPAVRRRIVRAAAAGMGCRLGADETDRLLALAGLEMAPGVRPRIGARLELRGGLRAERSARELQLSRSGTSTAEDVEIP